MHNGALRDLKVITDSRTLGMVSIYLQEFMDALMCWIVFLTSALLHVLYSFGVACSYMQGMNALIYWIVSLTSQLVQSPQDPVECEQPVLQGYSSR